MHCPHCQSDADIIPIFYYTTDSTSTADIPDTHYRCPACDTRFTVHNALRQTTAGGSSG